MSKETRKLATSIKEDEKLEKRKNELRELVKRFLELEESDNQLSKFFKMSQATVARRLEDENLYLLTFLDNGLSIYNDVMEKRKARKNAEINERKEQTKLLVFLFFNIYKLDLSLLNEAKIELSDEQKILISSLSDGSDLGLEKVTGISSSTVGRRLTNKEWITYTFPTNGEEIYNIVVEQRKKNGEIAKKNGWQNSLIGNVYSQGIDGKFNGVNGLKLNLFCKDLNSEYELLFKMALTFRLKLDMLTTLFVYSEKEILSRLETYKYKNAIEYLFYFDDYNEEVARANFVLFYKRLLKAKNEETMNRILSELNDLDTESVLISDGLQDEEMEIILNYQIKYALSNNEIIKLFNIDRETYNKRLIEFFGTHPNYMFEYKKLADYRETKKGMKRA